MWYFRAEGTEDSMKDMEIKYPARNYIEDMFTAFTVNRKNIFDSDNSYYGRLGSQEEAHKKAFFDIGIGLADFNEQERKDAIQIAYGRYVKFCMLKPVLDAKGMYKKMREGIEWERCQRSIRKKVWEEAGIVINSEDGQ